MAKEKDASIGSVLQELFQVGVYKGNQGRIARQVTAAALVVVATFGAWALFGTIGGGDARPSAVVGGLATLLGGFWLAYRIVNIPQFADFLIAVEAEMNKVSWPTWTELVRSAIVVIIVIALLAGFLFLFDALWQLLFEKFGIA